MQKANIRIVKNPSKIGEEMLKLMKENKLAWDFRVNQNFLSIICIIKMNLYKNKYLIH